MSKLSVESVTGMLNSAGLNVQTKYVKGVDEHTQCTCSGMFIVKSCRN